MIEGIGLSALASPGSQLGHVVKEGYEWVRLGAPLYASRDKQRTLVRSLQARGFKALWILLDDSKLGPTGKGVDDFASRCAKFAELLGPDDQMEIWNEPDHLGFWLPSPNADDYAALCLAVQSAIPHLRSWAGSLAYPTQSTAFLARLKDLGVFERSGLSIHPYRPYATPKAALRIGMRAVRAVLPDVEVLASEWGYQDTQAPPCVWTDTPVNLIEGAKWSSYNCRAEKVGEVTRLTPNGPHPAYYVKGDPGPGYLTQSCWLRSPGGPSVAYLGIEDGTLLCVDVDKAWRRYGVTLPVPSKPAQPMRWMVKPDEGAVLEMMGAASERPDITHLEYHSAGLARREDWRKRSHADAIEEGYVGSCWFATMDANDGSYGSLTLKGKSKLELALGG